MWGQAYPPRQSAGQLVLMPEGLEGGRRGWNLGEQGNRRTIYIHRWAVCEREGEEQHAASQDGPMVDLGSV